MLSKQVLKLTCNKKASATAVDPYPTADNCIA